MNKLFTKIVGGIIGLTMAIGVGVAIGNNTKMKVAEATTGTDTLKFNGLNSPSQFTTETTELLVCESNQGNIKLSHIRGDSKKTAANSYYPGANSRTSTRFYSGNTIRIETNDATTRYITAISFTASSEGYATALANSTWTNATASASTTKVTVTPSRNAEYVSAAITGTTGVTTCSVSWDTTAVVSPTVTGVTASCGSLTGTYKGDAYIQCSAVVEGTNNPSQTVNWTINTSDAYVANQTSVSGASIDSTGKVSFTNNVTVYAFATSTEEGYESFQDSVECVATGLLDPVTYVKIDKTSRLQAGMSVIIANTETGANAKALSVTQNTNNRADCDLPVSVSTYTTASVIPTKVQVFTLVAGSEENSFSFSFQDGLTTKYIFAAGSSSNYYLRTTTSKTAAASFTISIINSVATIKSCDDSKNGYLRHNNSNHLFACYDTNEKMNNCSIYMSGSSLPEDIALTGISDLAVDDVQVGDSVTLTASYTPTNATELFVATMSVNGKVTLGSVSMNNGSLSLSVTGVAAGEVTITLTGEESTSVTDSIALTVTAYSKTHDIITDDSSLFNGQKVILGNGTAKRANGTHTGGDNLPSAEIPFANDGLSLSNASGNATEYTIWNLTIKDSEENDVSGWAFYANGYFLTCTTSTSSNYLRRTLTLSSLCLFDIDISTAEEVTTCSIVCADTHVTKNTLRFNSTNKIFSCYASGQDAVQLYSNQSSSDANIVAGYERAFLKMGDIAIEAEGTGLCKTNKYYQYAKDVYVNALTSTQKSALSANAKNRLAAWADYNDEEFNIETGLFSSKGNLVIGGSNNNTSMTIVIVSIMTISLAGGYFLFKKKKQ